MTDLDICTCEEPGHIKAGGICMDCGGKVGHNASPIADGGPAFPMPGMSGLPNDGFIYGEPGMTLRDYFAAKALVGLFSMEANPRVGEICEPFRIDKHCDDVARHAYKLADAMLAARGTQS